MEWYQGGIADALSTARNDHKLIAVYVYGDNSQSEQVTSALESAYLSPVTPKLISIRLKQPSPELIQFNEIYPVLLVPSVYLICPDTGVSLDVLAGPQPAEVIVAKIQKVLESRSPTTVEAQSPGADTVEPTQPEEPAVSEGGDAAGASIDDKVQRAERLIELRRQEKAQQEFDEENRKERERREALKNVQRLKREMEDKELRDLAEQKQKEREEDKKYRAKLQEQIRQDRLERQQKSKVDQAANEERKRKEFQQKQEESERLKAQRASTANIMFRLPDGSTITNLFEASAPFIEVRQYIADMKSLTNFSLALNFPRRVFESDSDQQTLRDLQLAPSSVLLVISKSQSSSTGSLGGGQVRSIWDYLTVPYTIIMGYFASFIAAFFPAASLPAATSTAAAQNRDAPGPSRRDSGSSGTRQRKPYQRSGNIHRLNTSDESDNDNNTWNGNSTQQM